jgi:hypothetical protein
MRSMRTPLAAILTRRFVRHDPARPMVGHGDDVIHVRGCTLRD